ncbi:MAG: glutamine-hydrolyzing carbamoyl-phosphate synthase small subunit [Acidobacteria bacterium]|nr:glutamine-hydrolyzing carbamoyl-phosphate synthase small subunit [Acidobacteriota bacterium]
MEPASGSGVLALEDGLVLRGEAFGATGTTFGELVFNTALTGYQEVLTDPSYAGQIVVMTYPHIGNYGTNDLDAESRRSFVEGFVVRAYAPVFSNWRAEESLGDYLKRQRVVGLSGIDTRRVVRHIRDRGAMRACISSERLSDEAAIAGARAAPSMLGLDLASRVSCVEPYEWTGDPPASVALSRTGSAAEDPRPRGEVLYRVVAYDFGAKFNILRSLESHGCAVTVVPASTTAEDALALGPDGIFLSNGPGDPEPLEVAVANVRRLLGRRPVFGICLGHQILGLALGGRTFKLKFGHRGGNQPVKNLITGRVEITAQNHGFAVDPDSLPSSAVEITHLNLNDHTLEGMRHRSLPVFSVQYHPEASPGPHDAQYLFHDFIELMRRESRHGSRRK